MPAAALPVSDEITDLSVRCDILADLRRRVASLERGGRPIGSAVGLGIPEIDGYLPEGGLTVGAVHEFLGAAASSLAALVAGRLAGTVLWCLDVTCREEPYGPGLAALGLDPSRLVLARCRGAKEMLWVMEEGLRSTAPAAVIAEPEADIGLIESRRLQLAAEVGRTIGMVLRERGGEGCLAPSAVASRWQVDPEPCGGWRLILRRCRGTVGTENEWKAKYHDASGDLALAAEAGDGPGAASERFHLV